MSIYRNFGDETLTRDVASNIVNMSMIDGMHNHKTFTFEALVGAQSHSTTFAISTILSRRRKKAMTLTATAIP